MKISIIGEFFYLAIGIIQKVEEFNNDILDKERKMLKGKFYIDLGQFIEEVKHFN